MLAVATGSRDCWKNFRHGLKRSFRPAINKFYCAGLQSAIYTHMRYCLFTKNIYKEYGY